LSGRLESREMTGRFTGVVLLGLSLALMGALAWAQTPPTAAPTTPTCPAPGTIYTFTDSSSIQALAGAKPPFCRFANLNGGQQVDLMLGAFSAASPVVQANFDVLTSLLPLQVGKTVTLPRPGAGVAATVTVEKYETVEVPVGKLACYVLLWSEPSGQGRWERRWWYCPSLEYAAKYSASFEVVTPTGRTLSSNPASWELQSVRVP
jgi:hypothetical protein